MTEALAVGLARGGAEIVFGLAGSGNLRLINAARAAGIDYCAACHEAGAVAMADGYARVRGRPGVASVHQGPGVTNTATALAEAARSGTPLLLLAPEAPGDGRHANQALDPLPLAEAVGARALRLRESAGALARVAEALHLAAAERTPVVLALPIDLLEATLPDAEATPPPAQPSPRAPAPDDVARLATALAAARRPLIVGGRGAALADAGPALRELAERAGALLATTVVAKGLFAGDRFSVGFLGGLASPLATELAGEADLMVGFGTSLDRWTTCGGRVPGPEVEVALVDDNPEALARRPAASLGVPGDAAATAERVAAELADGSGRAGWRTPALAARIAAYDRAEALPPSGTDALDPHALTVAVDRLLPADRVVALDSGHFLAFPSMYMTSADGRSFLFAQGFQPVGLGLGIAIGAAVAAPGRIVAAMVGDGGAKMSLLELETAVRRSLPVLVVLFDDGGYGAEIHDFEPLGDPVEIARFPSRDYAAVARGIGAEAATVRSLEDLAPLERWVETPDRPLLLDCKVDPSVDAAASLTAEGAAEWSMATPVPAA